MRGDAVRRFLCNWKVLPCWDGTGEGTPKMTRGTLERYFGGLDGGDLSKKYKALTVHQAVGSS